LLKDLTDTITGLDSVKSKSLGVNDFYRLVQGNLSDVNRSNVKSQLEVLIKQVQDSRKEFSSIRRQTNVLKNIHDNLNRLDLELKANWKLSAEDTLEPSFKLYTLIRKLPDFQSQEVALNSLKNRLEYYKDNVPKNSTELREFHQKVDEFKKRLTSVQGLTPKIQAFLSKIVDHTATLTDLDDEVLGWCRKSNRSSAFMIVFKN
jgi:hypothetical protein